MPQETRTALRFTRIQLANWRNFRRVQIDLRGRAFLVGPNASGKSNFLDAFRFLYEVARHSGFQQAVLRRGGISSLRNWSAPDGSEIAIAVSIGSDDEPDLWEYEIRFGEDSSGCPALTAERAKQGLFELNRPAEADRQDLLRLTQTALEQISQNQDFREIAGFLTTILDLQHIPHASSPSQSQTGKNIHRSGTDFLDLLAEKSEHVLQARLEWLTGIVQVVVPQIERLKIARYEDGLAHLLALDRASGRWQTEGELSDGTRHLIRLLSSHLAPSGTILLEEPEKHLHPEVVRRLPQLFALMENSGGRQILLKTHSSTLLLDQGIGLDEVFLFLPGEQGTEIRSAVSFPEFAELLQGEVPLAEVVLTRTQPPGAHLLPLLARR